MQMYPIVRPVSKCFVSFQVDEVTKPGTSPTANQNEGSRREEFDEKESVHLLPHLYDEYCTQGTGQVKNGFVHLLFNLVKYCFKKKKKLL